MAGNQAPGVKDKGEFNAADASTVNRFHAKSDVDSSAFAQHHTVGPKPNQASPGPHKHTGTDGSNQLLAGVTITGAKAGNTALASVIAALVGLGATDSTT